MAPQPPVKYGKHERVQPGTPCTLCSLVPDQPHTDHCHRHGWVRGVLCTWCNTAMSIIDRRRPPRRVVNGEWPVTLEDLTGYVSRCPDCSPIGVADLDFSVLEPAPRRPYRNAHELRSIDVPQDLWELYADVVGNGGRSADLREYIDWRICNPAVPLPA